MCCDSTADVSIKHPSFGLLGLFHSLTNPSTLEGKAALGCTWLAALVDHKMDNKKLAALVYQFHNKKLRGSSN